MSLSSRVIKLARLADGVRVIPAAEPEPADTAGSPPDAPDAPLLSAEEREQIWLAGFEAGLAEGRRAAQAEAAAAVETAACRLRQLLESARLDHRRILKAAEEQLLILALAAAEKVLARKLGEADRNLVADFVAEALKEAETALESPEAVVLRVNPQDFEFVQKFLDNTGAGPRVIADPRIEAGGCVVETSSAVIDSTPTERLRQIARLFRQAHELEHRP